jgi:hypothetical protein
MSNEWRDRLAGARMQVDQQFDDRVRGSQFTNQEWGLIMTAVEFEIDSPDSPEQAELTANTDNLEQIMPELDNLPQGVAGAPTGGDDSGGGFLDSVKSALGFSGSDANGVDEDDLAAAKGLVEEYATQLQTHLEEQGRWEEIRSAAAEE